MPFNDSSFFKLLLLIFYVLAFDSFRIPSRNNQNLICNFEHEPFDRSQGDIDAKSARKRSKNKQETHEKNGLNSQLHIQSRIWRTSMKYQIVAVVRVGVE